MGCEAESTRCDVDRVAATRLRVFIWSGALIVAAVLCYLFPLFRVAAIDNGVNQRLTGPRYTMGVAEVAELFWNSELPRALDRAVEVEALFTAVDRDAGQAIEQFGRRVGLGGAWYLFVRGTGVVEELNTQRCMVAIDRQSRRVCIELGVILGNAVRDATGLLDVNKFASSQEFNSIAEELNKRVEQEVIAPAKENLMPGASVTFVGCAELKNNNDFESLCIIPIRLGIQNASDGP